MNFHFYNSTRHPIIVLHHITQESEGYVSFCIEVCSSVYEAFVDGCTDMKTFRALHDGLGKLYSGEQTELHVETTDGSLDITASMDMAGIIFWTFVLTEVGTRNRIEVKDCSDRTFLPEIMKSLTEWIEEYD